ncbi:Hypothetical protein Minf_0559 [Methylacidiphilum infernorum V4]|uniref:Uncharacterized protein n=1 Tax=Methylacidiphilum infernorum (isolate V4) TaxID=481448 RepID=B3DZK0_METI4|nr:Hypothetical protein Minf_0559 [Methylacidiphilum infernorum V4]
MYPLNKLFFPASQHGETVPFSFLFGWNFSPSFFKAYRKAKIDISSYSSRVEYPK